MLAVNMPAEGILDGIPGDMRMKSGDFVNNSLGRLGLILDKMKRHPWAKKRCMELWTWASRNYYKLNQAATVHHELDKVLYGQAYGFHKRSHTIPRNLRMVFHLIVRKNHVENVSDVGNGTWHCDGKVHRRQHMDHHTDHHMLHQMILGGTWSESDVPHRETDKKCKKLYEQLLLRQLDDCSCPREVTNIAIIEKLLPLQVRSRPPFVVQCRR